MSIRLGAMTAFDLTPEHARQVLAGSTAEPQLVRRSLLLLTGAAEYKLIGICAETVDEAVQALRGYLIFFGYPEPSLDFASFDQPGVYLKFNPMTGTCYVSPYEGHERGVIVSCFSPQGGATNDTYAHLPLDLFDEQLH
ncbi:MAG: DUF1824 family protein [Gemmatimonadaceae bacterium]|nr:DUF1824 family protein [Gloeobacterales cyanobacterium ES-bin-141]